MRQPESGSLTDTLKVVDDLFDLSRAYPITGGFDHFIQSADEIQVTLLVPAHLIA